jgi:Beta-propeller repeat
VRYANVYPGVSLTWNGRAAGGTEYEFQLDPGADPAQIELAFDGADYLATDAAGNLLVYTGAGVLQETKPAAYQEVDGVRVPVATAFRILGSTVAFQVGAYDRSRPLTIDPTVNLAKLAYSTFLGGAGDDAGNSLAVDALGSTYVTGNTTSLNFPTTAGAWDPSLAGEGAFVTKLTPGGGNLVYSTFLDGGADDDGVAIAVDASGSALVTGSTTSTDFPTTAGAFDTTANGGMDGFVTKLTANGGQLLYSTYLGGDSIDAGFSVAVDSFGNAYVTGQTFSSNFPTTAGALATTSNGGSEAFVGKINPGASGASSLAYSTYLGGSADDLASDVAVEAPNRVWLTGRTGSANFPTTAGAFDTTFNGINDAYATVLETIVNFPSQLQYSTYLGGSASDDGLGVAVDGVGGGYVTGSTVSSNFPTTPGAYDTTYNVSDAFLAQLRPAAGAGQLAYSTFLGGTLGDVGQQVAVDSSGNAWVTGRTNSSDFPTTADAFDPTPNGDFDVLVSRINTGLTGSAGLVYSTVLGSQADEQGNSIALDSSGDVYLAGATYGAFPTTPQAFQPARGGGTTDGFVSKLGNYSISGRAIDSTTGNPVAGVMVSLSGPTSGNVATGSDGRFGFTNGVDGGRYLVAASKSATNVNPPRVDIDSLDGSYELVFLVQAGQPSAVEVRSFAARRTSDGIVLRWRTGSAARIAGFDVYRGSVRVNRRLLPAAATSLVDPLGGAGFRYRLILVRPDGTRVTAARATVR